MRSTTYQFAFMTFLIFALFAQVGCQKTQLHTLPATEIDKLTHKNADQQPVAVYANCSTAPDSPTKQCDTIHIESRDNLHLIATDQTSFLATPFELKIEDEEIARLSESPLLSVEDLHLMRVQMQQVDKTKSVAAISAIAVGGLMLIVVAAFLSDPFAV